MQKRLLYIVFDIKQETRAGGRWLKSGFIQLTMRQTIGRLQTLFWLDHEPAW